MMPNVGARVLSADGDLLGTISAIEGNCFKVDAPFQPDYWLHVNSVTDAGGDVQLTSSLRSLETLGADEQTASEHRGMHRHSA